MSTPLQARLAPPTPITSPRRGRAHSIGRRSINFTVSPLQATVAATKAAAASAYTQEPPITRELHLQHALPSRLPSGSAESRFAVNRTIVSRERTHFYPRKRVSLTAERTTG